jgi:homoserine dehydrogenase
MKLKVALAGAGNVTRAFLSYWRERDFGIELRIVSVLRRCGVWQGDAPVAIDLDHLEYARIADPLSDAQLLIEALPSVYPHGEPATSLLRTALERGIDVLTVDKGPLVAAYHDLASVAARCGAKLKFCVGGALPAIDVAQRDLRGTTVRRIRAILNGTTNFIFSEMQTRNCSIGEALEIAVERGIAEPDPSQDLDGIDTAAKMVILVNAALGKDIRLDQVEIQGIRGIHAKEGEIWRLVGIYEDGRIRVRPELVIANDRLATVMGTDKIVEFDTVEMGTLAVIGGASGRIPMGATMTKEILNLLL